MKQFLLIITLYFLVCLIFGLFLVEGYKITVNHLKQMEVTYSVY